MGKGKGNDACCLLLNNNCERNEEPIKHTATAELRLRGSSRRKREVKRERGRGERGRGVACFGSCFLCSLYAWECFLFSLSANLINQLTIV